MTDKLPKNINEIRAWIKDFKRVMKKCPKNVWFFSTGELNIMVTGPDSAPMYDAHGGVGVHGGGGVNPEYKIDDETKHLWEGGDW